ncbi:MAG TPA: GTP-binding protein [Clostridiales bacterium]|nr:GTP-binding protein [Clostridiales bacterium]
MSKPVKIDLIAGFLGAGKTTFLNKLLKEAYFGEQIALLENEFGEIPLDGTLLAGYDIAIKEIANGCICCTLQGNFIDGITALIDTVQPDRIVIEPTGLAKLPDLCRACALAGEKTPLQINAVITVVDATMLPVFMEVGGEFFQKQIIDAKTVVLSHVQEMEAGESIDEVIAAIRVLNPDAPIFSEEWSTLNSLAVLTAAEQCGALSPLAAAEEKVHYHDHGHDHDHHHHHHHHHGDEEFASCSVVVKERVSAVWLEDFFHRLRGDQGGEIFRAKGLLHTENGDVRFDGVYGKISSSPYDFDGDGFFVVIGKHLDSGYWQTLS